MSKAHRVPLYHNDQCIGRVGYTDNLDYWDGHNFTCGATGKHLGVGRTRAGQYFLVHGTNWSGERNYAEVVSEAAAKEAVMRHGNDALYRKLFNDELPDLD